jgi:hypothetical protein
MSRSGDAEKHASLVGYWKKTKIALANIVSKLEDLLNESDLSVEDLAKLREALEIWEKQKNLLGRVPGQRYARGLRVPEPTEEDRERARVFMNWVRNTMKREMLQIKSRKATKSISSPPYSGDLRGSQHAQRPPALVSCSTESSSKIPPQENSHGHLQQPLPIVLLVPTTSPQRPPYVQKTENTSLVSPPSNIEIGPTVPRSIFDSLRTIIFFKSPSHAPKYKHVRISDAVTISSEHLSIVNPSPFKTLSRATTTAPHALHTTAEYKRHKYTYVRRHPFYQPGVWASAANTRKANTSFFHVRPWVMEMYVGRELKREEREKKIALQLKHDSWQWRVTALGETVAPIVGLEKLIEMKSRVRSRV